MKKARILSESGPLRTELGRQRYALPSPGCTWSSARSSQQRPAGANEPWVPVCMRYPAQASPEAARTNAPGPCMGRCVVTTLPGFTVPASVEVGSGRWPGFRVGRTVKSLYLRVKPLRECRKTSIAITPHVSNITLTRRQNVVALFQDYAERALASGVPPKGLEQAFAATLQISPSMWSQIKSSRPIGDKLARQIEVATGRSPGWLDEARKPLAPTPAELAFLDLALAAYRATNTSGRKALREQFEGLVSRP